ncbi:DUF1799 domain-containing protein [Desulfovibrio mangrovi]|uniref:DUF1799 domain-containing protein n=1 Tax=Desulfovibrio mangrovi TaxID=2976983 RepID=UPI0022473CA9|nr:DUF1799 domain-containing protein [Desulfovibrio mangrovi]UZP67710.1 DUF1799 domain-containing protein [Desulfovibrio mangrovi]
MTDAPAPLPCNLLALALWKEVQTDWNHVPAGMGGSMRTGLNWQAVDWRVQFLGIEWTMGLYRKLQHLERLELNAQHNALKQQRSS